MNLLCKFGIHRPLRIVEFYFTDKVTGKNVNICRCPCNKIWMSDGGAWLGFKMEVKKKTPAEVGKILEDT